MQMLAATGRFCDGVAARWLGHPEPALLDFDIDLYCYHMIGISWNIHVSILVKVFRPVNGQHRPTQVMQPRKPLLQVRLLPVTAWMCRKNHCALLFLELSLHLMCLADQNAHRCPSSAVFWAPRSAFSELFFCCIGPRQVKLNILR